MMRFGSYVLFTLCIGISLWFFGMPTSLSYNLGIAPNGGQAFSPTGEPVYGGVPLSATNFIQKIGQIFSNTSSIVSLLGIGVAAIGISALTGFSSMYFIPVVLLVFIFNFIAMPMSSEVLGTVCTSPTDPGSCTQTQGVPTFIYYPLLIIFNFLTIMSIISFIRGGV